MTPRRMALSVGALCALLAPTTHADSTLSGVCPDGSFFVVQSRESVPCANPHFADPDQLPPVRPYLLPRPYTWYVDQEARNPNNPYNLVETARQIRDARQGKSQPGEAAQAPATQPAPTATRGAPAQPPAPTPNAAPLVSLGDDELRDLVRLIALRQQDSPAQIEIKTQGQEQLRIALAYSASFEAYALAALGRDQSSSRVLVWSAQALRATPFRPNFFVVQSGRTFRPDPQNAAEIAYLLGGPGEIPSGEMAVGYLVVPASFDPAHELEVFWNDRSVAAVLAPTQVGANK
jgi:hypothetical protein